MKFITQSWCGERKESATCILHRGTHFSVLGMLTCKVTMQSLGKVMPSKFTLCTAQEGSFTVSQFTVIEERTGLKAEG